MKRNQSQRIAIYISVICFLSLLVMVNAQAKDTQPPIIAVDGSKLYAVSAEDGLARVLVEAPAGQTFFMYRFGSVSPDGKQLVYATATDPESPGGFIVTVSLLDLETGDSKLLEPSGGVFNKPAKEGYHFRIDNPTWSVDGSRLYYVRSATDNAGRGKLDEIQLAYWDMQTQRHKLVARLDPKHHVFDLSAVKNGIVVHLAYRLGDPQPIMLYGLDGRMVNQTEIENLYSNPVEYDGAMYLASGEKNGGIATLVNIETGKEEPIEHGYYPAARSHLVGEKSMHMFRFIGSRDTWYGVYGTDYKHYIGEIKETSGVHYAFSPDGQSLAFLQYDPTMRVPIRIIEANGRVRELPFKAQEVYWSATEWTAFYAPG